MAKKNKNIKLRGKIFSLAKITPFVGINEIITNNMTFLQYLFGLGALFIVAYLLGLATGLAIKSA